MLKKYLLWVITLAIFTSSTAFATSKHSKGFEIDCGILSEHPITINSFPMSVRAVPLHQDDDYLSGRSYATDPLPNKSIPLKQPGGFWIKVVWTPLEFCGFGIKYTLRHDTDNKNKPGGIDSEERYQQNQWGESDRVYGASLRFYEASLGGHAFGLTGLLKTPWWKIHTFKKGDSSYEIFAARLKFGGSYDFYGFGLNVKSGWDRYGHDEIWKEQNIGRLRENTIYISSDIGLKIIDTEENMYSIFLQIMYVHYNYSVSGDDFSLETKSKDNIVLGFGFGF